MDYCKSSFLSSSLPLCLIRFPPSRRLEFDAYRADLDELNMGPRDAVTIARIDVAQQEYQIQKDKYERLRSDVSIKLKFLEENKVFKSSRNILQVLGSASPIYGGRKKRFVKCSYRFIASKQSKGL